MANATFSFHKIKRSFFNVELTDGRKLLVKMPQKKTFEKITAIQSMPDDATADQMMDTFGALCGEILSNNMTGETVTGKYMADNYDFEEMRLLIAAFMDFISGVQSDPN